MQLAAPLELTAARLDGLAAALRELIERDGQLRSEARGNSMSPTIPDGTLVEVLPLPAVLVEGELLAFVPASCAAMVLHRVLECRADGSVRTRGDRHTYDDGWITKERQVGIVRRYWLGGRAYSATPGEPRMQPSRLRFRL